MEDSRRGGGGYLEVLHLSADEIHLRLQSHFSLLDRFVVSLQPKVFFDLSLLLSESRG
jgi:transcriptional regulator CtsR